MKMIDNILIVPIVFSVSVLLPLSFGSHSFLMRNRNLHDIPNLMNLSETVTTLNYSYTKIETVHPLELSYPLSIREVYLTHNQIHTIIRGAFDPLENLEVLDLSYNRIKGSSLHIETFKYEMGYFKRLRRLNLRGNHLGTLERLTFTAYGFTTLQYLDLSQCLLTSLQHMSIDNLGSLTHLNLSFNSLTRFEALSLEGLTELETLDLSNNRLTVLNEMSSLLSLKTLIMDNNKIHAIKENLFATLLGLNTLSLKGNDLKTVFPHILPLDSVFIREIRLDGNPWHCDCDMKWLVQDQIRFTNFTLSCAYPSRLRGRNIFDVPVKTLTCISEISRLTYILILLFSVCIILAVVIGGLIIYRRKLCVPCCRGREPRYVAVYNNEVSLTEQNESDKVIISEEENPLIKTEEKPDTEDERVQYSDD